MKQSHADMAREIEVLRHELDAVRHGVAFGHPSHPGAPHTVVYGHGPPPVPPAYPTGPPQPQPPSSRPGSSQNTFATNAGAPSTNGKPQQPM